MTPSLFTHTAIDTNLETAAEWLRQGTCIGIPTETVYGLAANALNAAAVARIFEVKNRPAFDPLIVHVTDVEAAEALVIALPPLARRLMAYFWPGPLTILLPRKAIIPDLVTSGLPEVALRSPAHPMAQALLRALPFPLAAPSANPFGYVSPTTAQHVFDQLQNKIPYILDGGPCSVGVESTIIAIRNNSQATVYRLGGIPVEALEAVVGPVDVQLNESSNPAAPGMLASHYAPRKPVYHTLFDNVKDFTGGRKIGLIAFGPQKPPAEVTIYLNLSPSGDLAEAAQQLFIALRQLDRADIDLIVAEPLPDMGLGRAINDRLKRAAAK